MADEKKTVTLIAVERGFLKGRMVEPGTKFQFDLVGADGNARKLPKWAVKDGESVPVKAKKTGGDIRPKDVQDSVKEKMGELSVNLV